MGVGPIKMETKMFFLIIEINLLKHENYLLIQKIFPLTFLLILFSVIGRYSIFARGPPRLIRCRKKFAKMHICHWPDF